MQHPWQNLSKRGFMLHFFNNLLVFCCCLCEEPTCSTRHGCFHWARLHGALYHSNLALLLLGHAGRHVATHGCATSKHRHFILRGKRPEGWKTFLRSPNFFLAGSQSDIFVSPHELWKQSAWRAVRLPKDWERYWKTLIMDCRYTVLVCLVYFQVCRWCLKRPLLGQVLQNLTACPRT